MFYSIEGRLRNSQVDTSWFQCYKFDVSYYNEHQIRAELVSCRERNKEFEFRMVKHTPVTDYLREIMNV